MVPWDEIDTVLVDMDGTLLDLAFDNFFWLHLVPACYASVTGITAEQAVQHVMQRSQQLRGQLEWYCLDDWSDALGMDLALLKRAHVDRIGYLPGAPQFLQAVRARGKTLKLVTNAHRTTLQVKVQRTGLDGLVDALISSHDYRAAKESREFWLRLAEDHPLDPRRTLLIEDSVAVLEAARAFGIAHTIAVRRPDSQLPRARISGFPSVDSVWDLV
jgi:5'-nucleotidase